MVEAGIAKLRKLIDELVMMKGRHTELVSIYVPRGANLNDIMNLLANEIALTQNVKSKAVRKNVIAALTKITQHLRMYKHLPENGVAVFCGNVAPEEGQTDIKIWAVEPPEPVEIKLYWCDQTFELAPLKEMVEEKEVYGLMVMDSAEASVGLLKGKKVILLRRIESIVPGKTSQGGQSAQRYERVRAGLLHDFLKKIAVELKANIPKDIKGILIGGPGPLKYTFFDGEFLPTDIKQQVLGVKDVGYTDESGLQELVERSGDLLAEAAVAKERALLQRFLVELQKGSGLSIYGIDKVVSALATGAIEVVIVNDGVPIVEAELSCPSGHLEKKFFKIDELEKPQTCPEHKQPFGIFGKEDAIDALREIAKNHGARVEVVSKEIREGQSLWALGGVGAILRYRLS